MLFPSIQQAQIPHGARVLLRASLNVPVQGGEVTGAFRLQQTARTIKLLKEKGARITVIGHLGRKGESLAPVHRALSQITPLTFIPALVGEMAYKARKNIEPGEALLLENTRTDPRETENDDLFVEEVAAQTDIFVFDDFSAAHREHASTVGLINELPSYAGILFYEEVTAVLRLTERLEKPAVAIISGAKCETKIPLIEQLLESYETVFVGGVIANAILKQRGFQIGASKVDGTPIAENILNSRNVITPHDVIATKKDFSETRMIPLQEMQPDEIIVDVGSKTLKAMQHHFENAKTILLNGPLGWCEKGFCTQTTEISGLVANTQAYSFVGGGETVALLEQHDLLDDWRFISTGGGSLLTYLAEGTLPVIEAFKKKIKRPKSVPVAQ
ncbi:MAG: phosphoglycerate kinase [Candidatus Kaiserbacteria bacterium]|nr:phosphoglycerate kinase [Candidatus Kaiserbacteria bacterium]